MRPGSITSNQTRPIEAMRSASITTSREVARRVRMRAEKRQSDEARGRFAVGGANCAYRRARLAPALPRCAARTPSAFRAARAAHAGKPASAFEEEKSRVRGLTKRVRDRRRMAVTAWRGAGRLPAGFRIRSPRLRRRSRGGVERAGGLRPLMASTAPPRQRQNPRTRPPDRAAKTKTVPPSWGGSFRLGASPPFLVQHRPQSGARTTNEQSCLPCVGRGPRRTPKGANATPVHNRHWGNHREE